MKHYLLYFCAALFLFVANACSSDDSNGSDNTTDVAVTGSITETGMTYAMADGYVNLDKLSSSTSSNVEIGIEYESQSGTGSNARHARTNGVDGRKISVELTGLTPGETYSYKTYVKASGIY